MARFFHRRHQPPYENGIPPPSSVKCHFCGGSPVVSRGRGDGPGGSGVCRDCVVRLTEDFRNTVAESTGIVDETFDSPVPTADEESIYEPFDVAFHRMSLLHGFERSIERAEETIITSWNGDSADKPPTRINEDLAHVRELLSRHGYREVSVVVGIDTELAARRQLGSFYQQPDPNDPHWTARVEFHRNDGLLSAPV
jgi:hypothetical protein